LVTLLIISICYGCDVSKLYCSWKTPMVFKWCDKV